MGVSRQIGKHLLQIDGDILFTAYRGRLSLAEMEQVITAMEQGFEGPYYAILDYSEMTGMDADARKRITEWTSARLRSGAPDRGFSGAAIYGASVTMRAVTILVQSAIRLLGKRQIPVVFVKNQEQARLCIAEMKQRPQIQNAV